jgi:hypothetical protein
MNNGFGTGVIFSTANITQPLVSGSVLSFKIKKQADKKEITDNADNFIYVGITKRKKVGSLEVLFTGSGSAWNIPEVGDTATFSSNTLSGDISGSWGVTDSEVDFKSDDACKVSYEITQWIKTGGSSLP